jgi:hypothetical protein
METFDDLGTVLSTHRVDNRRRLVSGFWAVAIGVVASALGWFLFTITDPADGVGPNRTVGAWIALGLCGLVIGAVQLSKAWRGGSDEYFEVREHGLLHANARQIRAWQWDAVTKVTINVNARQSGLARALGTNFGCAITFEDGSKTRLDGLATDAPAVARALREHCDPALFTDGMKGIRRLGAWWLAFAAAFLAGGIWIVVTIANSSYEVVSSDGSGTVATEVQTVSDTGYVFLGLGLLVCFLGLVTSLAFYFTARWTAK